MVLVLLALLAAPASAFQYSGNEGDIMPPSAGVLTLWAVQPPGISTVTIHIQGDFGDDETTAPAAGTYDLRYSTNPITDAPAGDPQSFENAIPFGTVPAPDPPPVNQVFTLAGLQPNTTYFIAMKIGDEVPNWSPLSNVLTFSTASEDLPPVDGHGDSSSTCANTIRPAWVFLALTTVALAAIHAFRRRGSPRARHADFRGGAGPGGE